jgi:hypothetical protein
VLYSVPAVMESEAEHSVPASPAASTSSSTEVAALVMNGGGGANHAINCPPIAVSPYFLDSALPSDNDLNYDHHSSEEELEVINSQVNVSRHHHHHHRNNHHHNHHRKHSSVPPTLISSAATPTSSSSSAGEALTASATVPAARDSNSYPEKRKWSQVTSASCSPDSLLSPISRGSSSTRIVSAAGESSSDEEVQGLMAMATPVEFRTSPPLDAHKPGHKPVVRSLSPPSKYFHYSPTPLTASASASTLEVSPSRKRHHRGNRGHHIPRPCLDFEKMQQVGHFKVMPTLDGFCRSFRTADPDFYAKLCF